MMSGACAPDCGNVDVAVDGTPVVQAAVVGTPVDCCDCDVVVKSIVVALKSACDIDAADLLTDGVVSGSGE